MISRRSLITSLALSAVGLSVSLITDARQAVKISASNIWQPGNYPDPRIKAEDPSFNDLVLFNARVERLCTGLHWVEGPVWFGDTQQLIFSDIPANKLYALQLADNHLSVIDNQANFTNGNTRDHRGRLISCQHLTRQVVATHYDGTKQVLASHYQQKKLNSPNDVLALKDGSLIFTDPVFGISTNYEGRKAAAELPESLYLVTPDGKVVCLDSELSGPNGLALSADQQLLYLVETTKGTRGEIARYDFDGKTLTNKQRLIEGKYDGLAVDIAGNLWCGSLDPNHSPGVHVFNSAGKKLGVISLPDVAANLCFGGKAMNRIFIAAGTSIYALYTNTTGI